VEYEFENDEEFEMLVDPDEPAPFPDISAEVTGMC
jgi:DNA polymerase III epsilon subunit-like protein